jgi:hypothetical protein
VRPAEELRLNTSIRPSADPKRLGVLDGDNAGFPNGRRLTDDVVDASLQVVAGELVGAKNDLGDGVDANDRKLSGSFPYVAQPTPGSRGSLSKGTGSGGSDKGSDARGGLGEALQPAASGSGSDNTGLIAASAGAGAAGILLLGGGLFWWRRMHGRA